MAVMKFMGHKTEKALRGFLRTDSAKEEGLGDAYINTPMDHDHPVLARSMNEAYLKMMGGTYTRTMKDEQGHLIEDAIVYEPNHPEHFPVDQNVFDFQNRHPDQFEINARNKPTDSNRQYGHFVIYLGHLKTEEEILKAQQTIAKSLSYRDFAYQSNGGEGLKNKIFKNGDAGSFVSPVHYQEGVGPHVHVIIYGRTINNGVYKFNNEGDLVQDTYVLKKIDPESGLPEEKTFYNNKKQISVLDINETTVFNKLFEQINNDLEKAGLSPLKSLDPKSAEKDKGVSEVIQKYLDEYGFASTDKIKNRSEELEEESKKEILISPEHEINDEVRHIITEQIKETNEAKSNIQKSHDFNRLVSGVLADKYKEIHLLETAKQISEVNMITEGKLIDANNKIVNLEDDVKKQLEDNENLINEVASKNVIIAEKDEKIESISAELEEAHATCDELTANLAEEEIKYNKLNTEFINLDKEYTEFQFSAAEEKAQLIEAHKNQIETLEESHQENVNTLTESYENIIQEQSEQHRISIAEKDIIISKHVETIEQRDETIVSLNKEVDKLKQELSDEKTAKLAVDELLKQANAELDDIKQRYNLVLSDNADLKTTRDTLIEENQSIKREKQKLGQDNKDLKEQNDSLIKSNDELRSDLGTAVKHMEAISNAFDMSEDEKKDFSNSIINEVGNLSEVKDTLEEDFKALKKYLKQKHKLDLDKIMSEIKNDDIDKNDKPKPKK